MQKSVKLQVASFKNIGPESEEDVLNKISES